MNPRNYMRRKAILKYFKWKINNITNNQHFKVQFNHHLVPLCKTTCLWSSNVEAQTKKLQIHLFLISSLLRKFTSQPKASAFNSRDACANKYPSTSCNVPCYKRHHQDLIAQPSQGNEFSCLEPCNVRSHCHELLQQIQLVAIDN